jgi:SPRY domain
MRKGNTLGLPSNVSKQTLYMDLDYFGFDYNNEMIIPRDVKYLAGIQFHEVVWDITRAAPGLTFDYTNKIVKTKTFGALQWQSVFGTIGFTSGIHYWSFDIMDAGEIEQIMIGVSKDLIVTQSVYPGIALCGGMSDKGVSYYAHNGYRYFSGTHATFSQSYTNSDIIGTLLNMNHKTITFYKNAERAGTAIGKDHLSENLYFPCISLYSHGQ